MSKHLERLTKYPWTCIKSVASTDAIQQLVSCVFAFAGQWMEWHADEAKGKPSDMRSADFGASFMLDLASNMRQKAVSSRLQRQALSAAPLSCRSCCGIALACFALKWPQSQTQVAKLQICRRVRARSISCSICKL